MNLPPDQVHHFYRIWFALLHYVNSKRKLVPPFPADPMRAKIKPEDAIKVRNELWADDALREAFIAENPQSLSEADLAVVESWKYRVAGDFLVLLYLKKHTIFLSWSEPAHAYGVLGLASPIDEVIGPYPPTHMNTVLLPWDGRIIYDGLANSHRIHFGPGLRRGFEQDYRNAREREGLITSLGPSRTPVSPAATRKEVATRNAKVLNAFRRDLERSGLTHKTVERYAGTATGFTQHLLELVPPRGLLELNPADLQAFLRQNAPAVNPLGLKRLVRFLVDSGRIDYETGSALWHSLM